MPENANTSLMPSIVIASHEWVELSAILREHLPEHTVWAFGSRATGRRVKRFSDLDLAVEGKELTLKQMALLGEALDESRLPFKVDVVELRNLAHEFHARIEPDFILVQGATRLRRAS